MRSASLNMRADGRDHFSIMTAKQIFFLSCPRSQSLHS